MSKNSDKYPYTFLRQMEAIVQPRSQGLLPSLGKRLWERGWLLCLLSFKYFFATQAVLKIGEYLVIYMMGKLMKTLELHYPMIKFLINENNSLNLYSLLMRC